MTVGVATQPTGENIEKERRLQVGKETSIEWTATVLPDGTHIPGATANFWWGCVKVSDPGLCTNCYAETWTNRYGGDFINKRRFIKSVWNEVPKWDKEAAATGIRKRVFCMSMGDFFELLPTDHPDFQQMQDVRAKAFELIEATKSLDWLVLTKRISNVKKMVPARWLDKWPSHVRLGISVGTQKDADRDIPRLLEIDCPNFLSMEPLLERVDLEYPKSFFPDGPGYCCSGAECGCMGRPTDPPLIYGIQWLITGGESGPHARPSHPDWFRLLRNQCEAWRVPFHFKQWGAWEVAIGGGSIQPGELWIDGTGQTAYPSSCGVGEDAYCMRRVGKRAAGHLLDGVEWHQFPEAVTGSLFAEIAQ